MNEILLYGTVGEDFWDDQYFTAAQVAGQLAAMADGPVTVRLNSGGGIANEGQAIYSLLRNSGREITVVVDGIAASAASLIAMAGDVIRMPLGSQMMIHDPSTFFTDGRGTEDDHLRTAKGLGVIANAYAAVYASRAQISTDEAREIMRAETWYDGPMAVAAGFATETDDANQAAAAALFDYGLYAHAPDNLNAHRVSQPNEPRRAAVRAAIMGLTARPATKGKVMPKHTMTAATANEDDDQVMTDDDDQAMESDDDQTMEGDEETMGNDEEMTASAPAAFVSSSTLAVEILDFVMSMGRPAKEARDYIAQNMNLAQVKDAVLEKIQKETPKMKAQSTARVTGDERKTRRTGMVAAIAHQIGRVGEVDGNARQYMNMTLAEMAARCVDYNGPLNKFTDRQRVFEMASHATSDFPGLLENALNKVLLDRYETEEPTYRQIARRRDVVDFRPAPLLRAGDFPMLEKVTETGEIKFGTMGEHKEQAILVPYAKGVTVSRQTLINDDLGAIEEMISSYSEMVASFEEMTFYALALNAMLLDGRAVYHTDHKNLAASGGGITVDTISTGRKAIRAQKSIDDRKLNLRPTILLTGPERETEAEQLVAEIQPTQRGEVNPFSGRLTALSAAEIEGPEWYLLVGSERAGAPYVYGFLDGAEGPRIRTEETFGTQGMSMTIEHDFYATAQDYRGGFKNPGA